MKEVESVLNSASTAQEEVNDATILDEIRRLVNEGQLSQAERMLQEFPIKDGEYHLIYAELHLKRNRTKAAMQEAEKALRVAAARISPSELREKVLYYKAKVLSVEYENAPDKQNGQKAMEAWYEVKYALRSNTAHPHYIKLMRDSSDQCIFTMTHRKMEIFMNLAFRSPTLLLYYKLANRYRAGSGGVKRIVAGILKRSIIPGSWGYFRLSRIFCIN